MAYLATSHETTQEQARGLLSQINIFERWKDADIRGVLVLLIEFLLILIGGLAVLFAIWSGFQYITSVGEPEKAAVARKTLTNVIIGIVVAALSFVAVAAISNTVGR